MFSYLKKINPSNKNFLIYYLFLILTIILTFFKLNLANAASDAPPFSLANTDFVVAISFFIFIGVLVYFKVPRIIINLLDKRSNTIRQEIDDANKLLEEAKSLLANSEREHKDNILKAKEIINSAEKTSKKLLEDSKLDIKFAEIYNELPQNINYAIKSQVLVIYNNICWPTTDWKTIFCCWVNQIS